jgi:hypothetical protein
MVQNQKLQKCSIITKHQHINRFFKHLSISTKLLQNGREYFIKVVFRPITKRKHLVIYRLIKLAQKMKC